MDCEICQYFVEHPWVREGDWTDYCDGYDKAFDKIDSEDIMFCPHFKEIEWND